VDSFIPLLEMNIKLADAHVKELIVGWITTLDSVPDIDMLDYLPKLLDGLFSMLTDSNKDLKKAVFKAIEDFHKQISEVRARVGHADGWGVRVAGACRTSAGDIVE
jgi:vacuole morphology and inheritance protein 14